MPLSAATLWPLSYLLIAVTDDLVNRKFHNSLFVTLTGLSLIYIFYFSDLTLWDSLGGFVCGGALMLPLVIMGAIGAGDMKFMMCFGALMGTLSTVNIFIMALFWGALVGVLQVFLAGHGAQFLSNMKLFAYKLRPQKTHKIPYTIAIALAWLTHENYGGIL